MRLLFGVTTYNSERTILRTLCSIRTIYDKFNFNIFLLVVDDASTDRTQEAVVQFIADVPNFKLHIMSKNVGVSVSRNFIISFAIKHNMYFTFVDGDDEVASGVERHSSLLTSTSFDVLCANFYIKSLSGVKLARFTDEDKKLGKNEIISYLCEYLQRPNRFSLFTTSWAKIYNPLFFEKHQHVRFNPKFRIYEDAYFLNLLIKNNAVICVSNVPVYIYSHIQTTKNPSVSFNHEMPVIQYLNFIHTLRLIEKIILRDSDLNFKQVRKMIYNAISVYTSIHLTRLAGRFLADYDLFAAYNRNIIIASRYSVKRAFKQYNAELSGGDSFLKLLINTSNIFLLTLYTLIKFIRRYMVNP